MATFRTAIQTMRWVVAATLVLTAACLTLNPAFEVSTTGATAGTASGAMTDGMTTGVETASPTTGSATTTPTTGAVTSTGAGSTTDMVSGTGGSTTGDAMDCWDLGIDAWTLGPIDLKPAPGWPSMSPDARTVYYRALVDTEWVIFRTTRPTVDDPFDPNGAKFFPSSTYDAEYADFVDATQELFYTGNGGDIYVVKHDGIGWGQPTVAGGVQAFGIETESHGNLTADGALLLFQRKDGPAWGQFDPTFNFYQITRDPQVHATFPDLAPLKVTPVDPGFGVLVCPAMAPDGLHLFFSGFDSAGGGLGDPNDGRGGVWYARRDAIGDATWQGLTRSEQLREPGFITCPVSISADGCHLTLMKFQIEGDGLLKYHLARRGG